MKTETTSCPPTIPDYSAPFKRLHERVDTLINDLSGNGCFEIGVTGKDHIFSALAFAFAEGEKYAKR